MGGFNALLGSIRAPACTTYFR